MLEVFHGDELLAVQRGDEGQAGIERAVAQLFSVQLSDYDGTGTAIAGCATFFGAGLAAVFTLFLTPAIYVLVSGRTKARNTETQRLSEELAQAERAGH